MHSMIVTFRSTVKRNRHFQSWMCVSPSLLFWSGLGRLILTIGCGNTIKVIAFWGDGTDLDGTLYNKWINGIITFTKSAQLRLNIYRTT